MVWGFLRFLWLWVIWVITIGATHLLMMGGMRCLSGLGDFCDCCSFGLFGGVWFKAWQFVVYLLVRSL